MSTRTRLDRSAQINGDNIARSPTRNAARVPPFTAASFEHNLVVDELWRNRSNPAEKLLFILCVVMRKLCPRPAELVGGRLLIVLNVLQVSKAWDAARDGERLGAGSTSQEAVDYFDSLLFANG